MKHAPVLAALLLFLASCSPSEDGVIECGTGRCDAFDTDGCAGPGCDDLEAAEFDFIVVGSGAGGATVAARLANSGHRVLVLEAGVDAGGSPKYQIPAFHALASEEPGLGWSYFVDHYDDPILASKDSKMTSKGILYPRGGTLGGSTAVNAMIAVLPKPSDWNRLADLTNDTSFASRSMHAYEQRLREWLPMEPPPFAGLLADVFEPELGLTAIDNLIDIIEATFIEVVNDGHGPGDWDFNLLDPFRKLGKIADFVRINVNDELREGNAEGAFSFPQTIEEGRRHSAREHLLAALATGNLTIKTQALVSRVVFENASDTGGCAG